MGDLDWSQGTPVLLAADQGDASFDGGPDALPIAEALPEEGGDVPQMARAQQLGGRLCHLWAEEAQRGVRGWQEGSTEGMKDLGC